MRNDTTESWFTAKVVSRPGKASGKYKNQYNLWKGYNQVVDFNSNVQDWSLNEDVEDETVLFLDSENNFGAVKLEELAKWSAMNVYDRVEDRGKHTVGNRWVLTDKNGVLKARLVAKGFQDQTLNNNPELKDSPTCSMESIRKSLSIILMFFGDSDVSTSKVRK